MSKNPEVPPKKLFSQLELLKKQLVISEARSGPDNPFVQGLKAQIAMHEKQRAENPCVFQSSRRAP